MHAFLDDLNVRVSLLSVHHDQVFFFHKYFLKQRRVMLTYLLNLCDFHGVVFRHTDRLRNIICERWFLHHRLLLLKLRHVANISSNILETFSFLSEFIPEIREDTY